MQIYFQNKLNLLKKKITNSKLNYQKKIIIYLN